MDSGESSVAGIEREAGVGVDVLSSDTPELTSRALAIRSLTSRPRSPQTVNIIHHSWHHAPRPKQPSDLHSRSFLDTLGVKDQSPSRATSMATTNGGIVLTLQGGQQEADI